MYSRSTPASALKGLVLTFVFGLALGLVPSGRVALACSCVQPPAPAVALAQSSAVFRGTVTSIVDAAPEHPMHFRVTFAVHQVWKGPVGATTVEVITHQHGATCGYGFTLGNEYIVYGQMDDACVPSSDIWTHLCTRTTPFDEAEASALDAATNADDAVCVCSCGVDDAPSTAVDAAVNQPASVMGWGQLRDPGKPASRFNNPRRCLAKRDPGTPYHPLYNSLVFKAGCY